MIEAASGGGALSETARKIEPSPVFALLRDRLQGRAPLPWWRATKVAARCSRKRSRLLIRDSSPDFGSALLSGDERRRQEKREKNCRRSDANHVHADPPVPRYSGCHSENTAVAEGDKADTPNDMIRTARLWLAAWNKTRVVSP